MSQRPFWNGPAASVLEGVGSSEAGLSAAEARARLKRIGPNEPAPPRRFEALRELGAFLLNPLVLILLVASAVSAAFGQVVSSVHSQLVPTFSGRTASAVARLRPRRPIVGLSHHQYALQQMALEWGVTPLSVPPCPDIEELWERSIEAAKESGIVNSGDRVVITAGTAVNIPGSTNVIKVDIA